MSLFSWILRIIGGLIIVLGWFAYIPNTWNAEAVEFMKGNILYPIIATIIGLIIIVIGGSLGTSKK
jgi:hypothetical protein